MHLLPPPQSHPNGRSDLPHQQLSFGMVCQTAVRNWSASASLLWGSWGGTLTFPKPLIRRSGPPFSISFDNAGSVRWGLHNS